MNNPDQNKSSKWKHALAIGAGIAATGLAAYGGHQIYKRQKHQALKAGQWGGGGWMSYGNSMMGRASASIDHSLFNSAKRHGKMTTTTMFDAEMHDL